MLWSCPETERPMLAEELPDDARRVPVGTRASQGKVTSSDPDFPARTTSGPNRRRRCCRQHSNIRRYWPRRVITWAMAARRGLIVLSGLVGGAGRRRCARPCALAKGGVLS